MSGRCNGNCGCGSGCQCGNGCNGNTNYAGDMKNLLAPILSAIEKNTALLESIRGEMKQSNHNKQEVKRLGDGKNNNNTKSFVVVDLRATCWNTGEKKRGLKEEIIEFSSFLVDAATGHIKSTFHEFVTPTENIVLSEYCKNYNGIEQQDVGMTRTGQRSLDKALKKHQAWISRLTNGNCAAAVVVTWTDWDCGTMLKQECSRKKLDIPDYFHRWIDLRKAFADRYNNGYWNKSVKEALEAAGLKWEGAIKGGESRAHNKSRLLTLLIHQGANLAITSRLGPAAAAPN